MTIDNVFVVPQHRGSGIAHHLLADAAVWGRAPGATDIRLSAAAGNEVAERRLGDFLLPFLVRANGRVTPGARTY